jgi:hypothetical protein
MTKTHLKGNGNVSSCQIETNMARIERSLQFMSIKTLGLTHDETWGKKTLSQRTKKMIKPFFLSLNCHISVEDHTSQVSFT